MGAHDGLPGRAPLSLRPAAGLAIVGLGASLAPLDIAVNVALPAITAHFRLQLGDVQWIVVCYVLVYGSLMLVCGKLGDLFGHRLIFRIGLGVSAVGCAACAAAPDWTLFLWARAAQGIGTALALSCTPALATSVYPAGQRLRALAGFAMTMSLAAAIGPLLGGLVVDLWGWPAVYWMRVPIAVVTLALSGLLPSPRPEQRPFDAPGALLLAACMSALLLALVLSQRPAVPGWLDGALLAAALAALYLYIRHTRTVAEPIIRPALFADAAFAVPNAMNALANLAGFAILLLTPYYLVNVLKLSAFASGLVLALAFSGGLAGAPIAAMLVPRIGRRTTAFAGVALVGLGLLPLGFTTAATALPVVALLLIVEGFGQGLLTVAYTDLVTDTLAARDRGVAGSLALLTRTIGIVSGASVLTALHAHAAQGDSSGDFMAGYRFAFTVAGGGLLAVLALSCLWPRAWFARKESSDMISKRTLLVGLGGLICVPGARPARAALPPVSTARHEQAMRLAIEQGRKNPYYPYGAVITEASTGAVVAEGTNDARSNPTLHGEIVCINDYISKHGNKDWDSKILYTTCEPCPMCMTALIWAKIGGVVFASSAFSPALVASIGEPIKIPAQEVIDKASFHKPMLLGGVLAAETDAMFTNRKRY